MGRKVHPRGFRIGPTYTWTSRWFAERDRYRELLVEDVTLRETLFKRIKKAGIANVEIERSINKVKITLHVSRPGIVIGRGGSGLEELKKFIENFIVTSRKRRFKFGKLRQIPLDKSKIKVELLVEPVKAPNLNAYLVAVHIADQIIKRLPHRRVVSYAMDRVMTAGARGVKISLAGRIGGAEIARSEKYKQGTVPVSTIREEVDYAEVPALTKSGYVGVKVWICPKSTK
ncbi:30S ribosomal protein S3 [Patescibacteria group bacterium]